MANLFSEFKNFGEAIASPASPVPRPLYIFYFKKIPNISRIILIFINIENPNIREEIIIDENHLGLYLDLLPKLRQKDYLSI